MSSLVTLEGKRGITMLLSGAGPDELLGGYGYFDYKTDQESAAASLMVTYNLYMALVRFLDIAPMMYAVEDREPLIDIDLVEYSLR